MKEAMFDGPEVLDKMLEDADQANYEYNPDETDNVIVTKEEEEELNNILNDLGGNVVEEVNESNDNTEDAINKINENEIPEDANNNISENGITKEVPPKPSQILTFEKIYNINIPASDNSNQERNIDEQTEINGNNVISLVTSAVQRYVLFLAQYCYFK